LAENGPAGAVHFKQLTVEQEDERVAVRQALRVDPLTGKEVGKGRESNPPEFNCRPSAVPTPNDTRRPHCFLCRMPHRPLPSLRPSLRRVESSAMNDYDKAGRYMVKREPAGNFRWLLRNAR